MAIVNQINVNTLDPRSYSFKDVKVIGEYPISSEFNPTTDIIEYYIYDINQRLLSYDPNFTQYKVLNPSINQEGLSTINLNVEQVVNRRGFDLGTYQIVFNFLRNELDSSFLKPYFIKEISSNRTEIRIGNNLITNNKLEEEVNKFKDLNASKSYFPDFFINFGNNKQFIANNIILDRTNVDKYSVLIKLYAPLPIEYEKNNTLWIAKEVANPKAFSVEFEPDEVDIKYAVPLKGPNYNIDVKDNIANSTTFKSNDDLLNIGPSSSVLLSSSYNQLQNILNKKGINININYTTFSNFCHFSSVEQRLENFSYKIGQIESASSQISQSHNITSSYTASNDYSSSVAKLEFIIDDTIKNFDGYENFLYYNTGSSDLHWPKSTTSPIPRLLGTGSSEVIAWYGSTAGETGIIYSASLYDQENQDNLVYTIPEYLREDSSNAPYQLFIEMMGQYFDELYFYANDITNRYDADNRLDFGVSKDIVGDVLKSFGIKLYENNFTSDDLYASLIGINASGSLAPPTGSEVIETYISASNDVIPLNNIDKETYKRIYHNMPYLLKKKGSVEGLRALINVFGIPSSILRISEFGGKDLDNTHTPYDYYQNTFNYGVTGFSNFSSSFTANSVFGGDQPNTVAFRFRYISGALPASNTNYFLQTTEHTNGNITNRLTLKYMGGNGATASFSGSIVSASEHSGKLTFGSSQVSTVSGSLFNGEWWTVALTGRASAKLYVGTKNNTEADGFGLGYVTSSQGDGVLIGNDYRLSTGTSRFEFQEVRFYNTAIGVDDFKDLVMNPHSIQGNTISTSKDNLWFRAPLGSELDIDRNEVSTNYTSMHPAITGSSITNSFASDSNYQFRGSTVTYNPNTESIYYNQPNAGLKNRISNKIRIGGSHTIPNNILSPERSVIQDSEYGGGWQNPYGRDINRTEIAFSPTNEVDDDIISSLGYFNIGEYIGDPNYLTEPSASYRDLNILRDNHFKKYYKSYGWRDYVRLIKYFDNSLFNMIKDFTPARTSLSTGVVIKQHLLERNKYPTPQVSSSQSPYTSASMQDLNASSGSDGLILVGSQSAGTGGTFNPENILIEPGGSILTETDNKTLTTSFTDLLTADDGSKPGFVSYGDVFFVTGSTNQIYVTKVFNTAISFSTALVGTSSSTFTIKIVSDKRGTILEESVSWSSTSTFSILTSNIDLFPGELISFEGKADSETEVDLAILKLGADAENSIPTSQQVTEETIAGLSGSLTVYHTDQKEFYNGELFIRDGGSTNVVSSVPATNMAISSSMMGPLPLHADNVTKAYPGVNSTTGIFSFEQSAIQTNINPFFNTQILGAQQATPLSFGKSVYFIRNADYSIGTTRMILGIATGSDQTFSSSLDNLTSGDKINMTFTDSPYPLAQPINVPYEFTIGNILKNIDTGYGTAYYDISFLGDRPSPNPLSYIFNYSQVNAITGAPATGTNGTNYGTSLDLSISIPKYTLNIDGSVNNITNASATTLLNEANPIVSNAISARQSTNYSKVDYDNGIIIPTNLSAITNNIATRASIQDSNYTKTGHINARYNGSRASSPGFNIRSKIK